MLKMEMKTKVNIIELILFLKEIVETVNSSFQYLS